MGAHCHPPLSSQSCDVLWRSWRWFLSPGQAPCPGQPAAGPRCPPLLLLFFSVFCFRRASAAPPACLSFTGLVIVQVWQSARQQIGCLSVIRGSSRLLVQHNGRSLPSLSLSLSLQPMRARDCACDASCRASIGYRLRPMFTIIAGFSQLLFRAGTVDFNLNWNLMAHNMLFKFTGVEVKGSYRQINTGLFTHYSVLLVLMSRGKASGV